METMRQFVASMKWEQTLITNDAVVLGILLTILALVFATSESKHPGWQRFYKYVPSLLLCYFIPSILGSLNIISGEHSKLYFVASRYLLPTSLVLLTLCIDLQAILRLGYKAITMFLAGTVGIVIGGPLAIWATAWISPQTLQGEGANAIWKGMATLAGSWIGGGANQTAMKEVFQVSDSLFSAMVTVDVLVASVWMAFLLYGAGRYQAIDEKMGADNSAIEDLKTKVAEYQTQHGRIASTRDLMVILGIGFGVTAFSHLVASAIGPYIEHHAPYLQKFSLTSNFFWLIVTATTAGLILSFTRARALDGAGASRIGSVLLYILVASIGVKMDLFAIFDSPGLFLLGGLWILVHIIILLAVAKLIKAPFFFVAVGSQANIGGAASAPIVATAVHPTLAPVGVLLAVLGYALGTYGAWFCAQLMRIVSECI